MTDLLEGYAFRDVSRETRQKLERFATLLIEEAARQNLIAKSTEPELWSRHILDSIQLLPLAPPDASSWIDIGSGAGLPGIPVACFHPCPMTLVEPRRLRADFLTRAIRELELEARVRPMKAQQVTGQFDVVSARAVASLHKTLAMTWHLSHGRTTWILPKGRNAKSELEETVRNWQCEVREVPSRTSPDSTIFVISKVKAKHRP